MVKFNCTCLVILLQILQFSFPLNVRGALTNETDFQVNVMNISSQFLYKCSNQIVEQILEIPKTLQYPYNPKVFSTRLLNFALNFNTSVDSLYNFRLVEKQNNCDEFSLKIPKFFDQLHQVTFNFTPDGWLGYYKNVELDGKNVREEIYFHRENYCIDGITPDHILVKVCKSQCYLDQQEKGNHPCIPKCCKLGRVMTSGNCRYVKDSQWMPPLYNEKSLKIVQKIKPNFQHSSVQYYWNCSKHSSELLELHPTSNMLRLQQNGMIYMKYTNVSDWFKWHSPVENPTRDFCVDGYTMEAPTVDFDPSLNKNFMWTCKSKINTISNGEHEFDYILCLQILFGIILLTSIILSGILGIYGVLWDKQNIHGFTVFALVVNQFMLNLIRLIQCGLLGFGNEYVTSNIFGDLHPFCIGWGILVHFFLLSSFSWTTVVSFDVWYKIRSMRPMSGESSTRRKRFAAYCAFGTGIPFFILIISILMEFYIGEEEDNLLRPGYRKTCAIVNFWEYIFYVSLIISTLFMANMFFVLSTIKAIWDAKKNVTVSKDSGTSSNFENKASLVGKLFILMGVFLLFEITLSLWNPTTKISIYFICLESFRIFHAIGLFNIFIWNKKTFQQLSHKFPFLKPYLKLSSVLTNTTVSVPVPAPGGNC